MLYGLVLAEMEVRVQFLEMLQANIKPEYKHSGAQLGDCLVGMPNPFNNNICAVLAFENTMVHIRLHRRAAHQIADKHECIHFA